MGDQHPVFPAAVVVPLLAFPASFLCILPIFWHFSQRNIAAGSLILWMAMINFFNAINACIWSRDNLDKWYNGKVLCDIEIHVQVGAMVALTACAAVVARKLAQVMDTRNITLAPTKRSLILDKVLEIGCCWVYPAIMSAIYYIVQPNRYYIFGIAGCVAPFTSSWPSLLVTWIWAPATNLVAVYYAGLLIYRLHCYRSEFVRLISARNTTKSRFVRLFLMSFILIVVITPYNFFLLYLETSTIMGRYSWSEVHGPSWSSVKSFASNGIVRFDVWPQIAAGYMFFFLFGMGTDAHNTYKRMLCAVGLGKIFPSLHIMSEVGRTSTPCGVTFLRKWSSTLGSKAKSIFSSTSSTVTEILPYSVHDESRVGSTKSAPDTLQRTHSDERAPSRGTGQRLMFSLARLLSQREKSSAGHEALQETLPLAKPLVDTAGHGVFARAWAVENRSIGRSSNEGVHVHREVVQESKPDLQLEPL